MNRAKILSLATLAIFFSDSAQALEQRIECEFKQTAFGFEHKLDRITLDTGNSGGLILEFQNGEIEKLEPTPGMGGIFEEISFPTKLGANDLVRWTYAQGKSSRLKLFQIRHVCFTAGSDIFCNPRGTGPSTEERTEFHFNGRILKFDGDNLPFCKRSHF